MKTEEISKPIHTKVYLFENTIKGILYNIAPKVIGDLNLYKRLKAFIFSKNNVEEGSGILYKNVKADFLNYYKREKVEDIISLFVGMQEIVRQNNLNNEGELDKWMSQKKEKMRKRIFGDTI